MEEEFDKINWKKLCRRSSYFASMRIHDKAGHTKLDNHSIDVSYPFVSKPHNLYFSFTTFCTAIAFLGNVYSTKYHLSGVNTAELVHAANYLGSDYLLTYIMRKMLNGRSCTSLLVAFANNFGLDNLYCYEIISFITQNTGMNHAKVVSLVSGPNGYISRHLYRTVRNHLRTIYRFWSHHKSDALCPMCGDAIKYGSPYFTGPEQQYMFMDCCFILGHKFCVLEYTTRIEVENNDDPNDDDPEPIKKACPECGTIYQNGYIHYMGPYSQHLRCQRRLQQRIDLWAVSPNVRCDVYD